MPYRSVIQSPGDVVRYIYKNQKPYNNGIYRKGFSPEIAAEYKINSNGWNSDKEYTEQRSSKKRIAVIGDSFVEAFQVPTNKSLSEVLERSLIEKYGCDVETYRFGFSGAPLSQYLQMMRYVKEKYHPDIFIIIIIQNDFLESMQGFNNSAGDFLQFAQKGQSWIEVKPIPRVYKPSWSRMLLKNSATIRFFYWNLGVNRNNQRLANLFKRGRPQAKYEMNVDIDEVEKNIDKIRSLTYRIFSLFKETAGGDSKLLLVMDGNRRAIYAGKDPRNERIYVLTKMAMDDANKLSIPFIDLDDFFRADYKNEKKHFEFKHDGHWNEKGNSVVGNCLADYIFKNKWCRD